jgi:hypothetical protein
MWNTSPQFLIRFTSAELMLVSIWLCCKGKHTFSGQRTSSDWILTLV